MKVSIFEAIGALNAIAGEVESQEGQENIELLKLYFTKAFLALIAKKRTRL